MFSFSTLGLTKELTLEQQRKLFAAAEYDAKKGRVKAYRQAIKDLGDYPLAPYVELAYLKKYPYLVNKKRIRHFLNLYTGTPLEWPLRKAWLTFLGKKNEAVIFLNDYRKTNNAELNCYKLQSELAIGGKLESIVDDIKDLWIVGQSQPKACDGLFKQWTKNGYRTTEDIKKRIVLAADGGKHSLLPYLIKQLPDNEKAWANLWYKVRRDPRKTANINAFKAGDNEHAQIVHYGLKRLIWRDEDAAIDAWQQAQTRFTFTKEQKISLNQKFALALASQGDERALRYFKHIPVDQLDNQLRHWHLALLLQKASQPDDWQLIVDFITSLPTEAASELSNQYWLARAQESLGQTNLAQQLFKKVALERHYYGFLAAAQVNQVTHINNYPFQAHYEKLDIMADAPAAKRAFEFLQLERYTQARREWWHLKRTLTKEEKATAAILASRWDWHDQALSTISQAGYLDDVNLRFPLAYQTEFEINAKKNKIPTSLAFAVARRESTFMSDANSSAGAKGLMQLMPGTAKQVAGRRMSTQKLFTPNTNIKLGTTYLRQLLDRVDEQYPLAIASYNAGYHRVIKWIPQDAPQDFDLWIETIPYKETREYVKAVLAYQQVYEQLLGNNKNLFIPLVSSQIIKRK